MITYKRNPLVSFELPLSAERRFLIASGEIAKRKSYKKPVGEIASFRRIK